MDWTRFFNDPSMVTLMVGGVFALIVLMSWHFDKNSPLDFKDLLIDPKTGKASMSQLGVVTALAVSSWGFISQIQDGKMTEFYFLGYMAAWTAYRAVIKNMDKSKPSVDTPADDKPTP